MSGKSYTMKEMKAIVEYLTEHRAYGEIKGRKMWMDLASSKITNRTWQSLKETFLKRILPDIHNPYYKLNITQITSFRQGQDVEAKLSNRLKIRSTSHNSDTEGDKEKDAEKPGNSNGNIENEIAGEDPKQSNLRASTETLVLENCYETAEDIRKDLQSPTDYTNKEQGALPTKSMRELITYSEPLTPMLQGVIDDFVTDDEEPQMQIVEPEETKEKIDETQCNTQENVTIEISDSEGNFTQDVANQQVSKASSNDRASPTKPSNNQRAEVKSQAEEAKTNNKDLITLSSQSNETNNEKNNSIKNAENEKRNSSETTQNNSTNIADTLLPGNQEAFEKNKPIPQKCNLSLNKNTTLRSGRKRASSQDVETKTKRKKNFDRMKSTSDTEKLQHLSNKNILINSNLSTATQNLPEECKRSSNANSGLSESTPIHEEVTDNLQSSATNNSTGIENPCLKNVSLYAEKFSNEKYTDSEMSNTEDDKNKKEKNRKRNDKNEKADNETKLSEKENAKTGGQNKNEDKNDKTDKNKTSKDTIQDTNKEKNVMEIDENEKTAEKSENSTVDTNKTRDNKTENLNVNNKKHVDNKKMADDKNKKDDKANYNSSKTRAEKNDNDVVMLEVNSDSATDRHSDQVRPTRERSVKEQRDRALANVFGFATGDTSRRQRRVTDRRKRTISHSRIRKYVSDSPDSSDWTSDTGSEYVSSPPRKYGRKGKHTRKYLKPRSAPVLSLEEEGGLFVMYGKKIYPIVKDGKIVKSYLSYMPEDEVDTEESFWKLKYVEEKKKTAELTKLLNQAEGGKRPDASCVQTLPTITQNDKAVEDLRDPQESLKAIASTESSGAAKPVEAGPATEDKKTVKLKFTKKDGEVIDIEGPWSALNPMVQHVAQLCASGAAPRSRTSSAQRAVSVEPVQESGKSTPIEEVQQKVNEKEQEIYKEIEKYHEEEIKASDKPPESLNVTKRKGRPRKTSPAVPPSPAKKIKPNETAEQNVSAEVAAQPTGVENIIAVTKRRTRTPKKLLAETVENQNTIVRTRRNTPKKPQETPDKAKQTDSYDLDEVRYKFPSPPPKRTSSKTAPSELPAKKTRRTKSDASQATARENLFINSIESTQGYQDSDFSPPIICIQKRRKMRLSYPTHTKRHRRYFRRSHPDITDDISGDSSNSFQGPRIRSMTFQNSIKVSDFNKSESFRLLMNKDPSRIKNASNLGQTAKTSSANDYNAQEKASNDVIPRRNLDPNNIEPSMTSQNSSLASDVYSSESYRLLMNKNPSRVKPTFNLGRIVESSPPSDFNEHNKACNEDITNGNNFDPNNVEPINVTIGNENSSNVSLPTSPVLSIVENISVDKSFLSNLDDYTIDDERRDANAAEQITLNGLMEPYNDVSMPLMQQDCDIEKSRRAGKAFHYNLSATKNIPDVSESLVKRIDSINIQDPVSESFNAKLRDLLLESCKKMSAKNHAKEAEGNKAKEAEGNGKPKPKKVNKKRSSTPRKRQSVKKSTPKNTEPVIVEEHMESCSYRSRQSCPPIILVSEHDGHETNENTPAETESQQFLTVKPTRGKKKKDIIKVKIKKPKPKGRSKSDKYDRNTNVSDSGINDTISDIIHRTDGSVELIHNHSDTCLNAHECMGDSVVIVENCTNSIISLVSNSDKSDNTTPAAGNLTQELFFSDAQDGSDMVKEFDFVEPKQVSSGSNTIYRTAPETHSTPNSIMTDDLSQEIPDEAGNNRWYLFSDDELSNIDRDVRVEAPVIGARLDQIFPITCAVPNLSTITEASRENGDSKKFCDNTNTRDGFNSPNIFI